MAAALGGDLMAKVLGHSEAERIVRPWWEKLEDFCVYGLLLVGVILIPHAIILGTPIFCTYCQKDFCGANHTNTDTDPGFQAWWVARYCTYNGKNAEGKQAVNQFISFYPYIILGLGIALFSIDKIVEILFSAKEKLDKFHKVLVDNKILNDHDWNEDHESSALSAADGSLQEIEFRYAFRKNQNFYNSFILRSAIQIVLASAFLFFITIRGLEITAKDNDIYCNAHGYWHECHGIPMKLYEYSIYFNSALISVYILTNIYNILWVLLPWFGKLSSVMRVYKKSRRAAAQKDEEKPVDKKILGDLYELYYNNRDLKLFLELLAMGSGVAPAISVMAMFDSEFKNSLKANIEKAKRRGDSVKITITAPESAVMDELDRINSVDVMYVAELDPPTADGAQVFDIGNDVIQSSLNEQSNEEKISPTKGSSLQGKSHTFTFKKLKDEKYTVVIRTLVNGRTVVRSKTEVEDSTRASVHNAGGMAALRKNIAGKTEGQAQASKSLEKILDTSAGNSSEEEAEEEQSLHDKVQAEHMNEIEKKKEREENFASSQQKC